MTLLDCTKAFDKCQFDNLFSKLINRKIPAVVVRVLMFAYQEQQAWVKWGRARSRSFQVTNGTRQGSILSPALFSVYMNDLIVKLRKAGVGCHVGGVYCGVVGYADDLCLMAPNRSSMEMCEEFATENNLQFSTDPDPLQKARASVCLCKDLRSYPDLLASSFMAGVCLGSGLPTT